MSRKNPSRSKKEKPAGRRAPRAAREERPGGRLLADRRAAEAARGRALSAGGRAKVRLVIGGGEAAGPSQISGSATRRQETGDNLPRNLLWHDLSEAPESEWESTPEGAAFSKKVDEILIKRLMAENERLLKQLTPAEKFIETQDQIDSLAGEKMKRASAAKARRKKHLDELLPWFVSWAKEFLAKKERIPPALLPQRIAQLLGEPLARMRKCIAREEDFE